MQDYIDGNGFKKVCECTWQDAIPNKDKVIIYANTHEYQQALNRIAQYTNIKFILVTHNSDHSIERTDIPINLIKWYGTNVNYVHEKISPIPIGLENEHWHPNKRNLINKAIYSKQERKNRIFAQFNPDTFPSERYNLCYDIWMKKINADMYRCINGIAFDSYVNNLCTYKYCLCPRGNGIDTHRVWEALYLGCIPIVKKHITHFFNEKLPIVYIDDWKEVTEDFLKNIIDNFDYSLFKSKTLTMTYWKERILNEANQD
jgi:hypothetical protein